MKNVLCYPLVKVYTWRVYWRWRWLETVSPPPSTPSSSFFLESCNGLVLKKIKQSSIIIKIATEFVKIEKIITARMTWKCKIEKYFFFFMFQVYEDFRRHGPRGFSRTPVCWCSSAYPEKTWMCSQDRTGERTDLYPEYLQEAELQGYPLLPWPSIWKNTI